MTATRLSLQTSTVQLLMLLGSDASTVREPESPLSEFNLCLCVVCKEGDVRLTNGSHSYEGTVEVCLDNTWCLVAQHGWDDADARVVCKQIGKYNSSGNVSL